MRAMSTQLKTLNRPRLREPGPLSRKPMLTMRKAPAPSAGSAPSSTGRASERYTGPRLFTSISSTPSSSMGTSASTSIQRNSSDARASALVFDSAAIRPIMRPEATKGQGGAPG